MQGCSIHKKYKGKRVPKNECPECLAFYLLLKNRPRILPRPTKVMRDKSKYTRKDKHKKRGDL